MMNEGFAPYDGEWWNFSYGDKEWACYYKKEMSLYNQVNIKRVFKNK
jgi:D-alanyl-D-alanine dipeptidase